VTDFEALAEGLSMTELVRLQDVLSKALVRRFERRLALAFSDIVGSTPYFAHFGDEAGRKLQQRHYDLVAGAIAPEGGRIVDTAGDGVFLCFDGGTRAARAAVALQRAVARDNDARSPEHRLSLRIGVHVGPVLTDGALVSGDAVNYASRIASSAGAGELRLSLAAYADLIDHDLRLRTRRLPPIELKGFDKPQEAFTLDWLDPTRFPTKVAFEDGRELRLPPLEVIRFGRLREVDGVVANDVVISVADPALQSRVSRWHFELHRRSDGFRLRNVSASSTEVDGRAVARGDEIAIAPGATVRVAGAITLVFKSDDFSHDRTVMPL
jgi:class 3 adenylate cyclase